MLTFVESAAYKAFSDSEFGVGSGWVRAICRSDRLGLWIVAGQTGTGAGMFLATSPDLVTWTRQTLPVSTGFPNSVVEVPELDTVLLGIQAHSAGSDPDQCLFRCDDAGITWTNVPTPFDDADGCQVGGIASDGSQLLLAGYDSAGTVSVCTTTDLSTITAQANDLDPVGGQSAHWSQPNNVFVVGGYGSGYGPPDIVTTPDGASFTTRTSARSGAQVTSFVTRGSTIIAATASGLMRSTNGGATWSTVSGQDDSFALATDGTTVVGCGTDAPQLVESTDGSTYDENTSYEPTGSDLFAAAYSATESKWVIGGVTGGGDLAVAEAETVESTGVKVLVSSDPVMTAEPSWTRLDIDYAVQHISTDRGRSYEMEKTGTGTATVTIADTTGAFDPTQSPLVDVMNHIEIQLENADDIGTFGTIFRGFVSSVRYDVHPTERVAFVTIECNDALALLAAMEMTPDGTFGDAVVDGNIVFNELDFTDAVQRRIGDGTDYPGVLTQAGWPDDLRSIFTGNVWLQKTVYAPRSSVLQVLQDAADAEFPGVANVYIGGPRNPGKVVVHGRLARFNPDDPDYEINTYQLGGDAACLFDPTTVRISPPLTPFRDDSNLFTAAIATPQNIADADIASQYSEDATAVTAYGRRTWSAENLATGAEDTTGSTTALEATALFRDYYLNNYKQPRTRVGQITVKGQAPGTDAGTANWAFLIGVDISDVVHLKTSHFGYSAFDDDFYVEGIQYDIVPGGAMPIVVCTLDVSPGAFFLSNPF